MPDNSISITLSSVPGQSFKVRVREYKPKKKNADRRCPGPTPSWVRNICKNGIMLSLPQLVDHAGSHFIDINQRAFSGGANKGKLAAALAWAIISMLRPSVKNKLLIIQGSKDSDTNRLCTEIFGVGAALHLLSAAGVIDFRSISKLGKDFDYEAYSPTGQRILIEAKGTFQAASLDEHRLSFKKKLKRAGLLASGASRGYSSAIGIIFSTWSVPQRKLEVELLDPEYPSEVYREEYVRSVIRFYARRFGEDFKNQLGAQRLFELSDSPHLFVGDEPLFDKLGSNNRESRVFYRTKLTLRRGQRIQDFLGSFWESRAVEAPYFMGNVDDRALPFAFVGFDRAILQFIRSRRFNELLEYQGGAEEQFVFSKGGLQGQFSLDQYGVLRSWLNGIPDPDTVFDVVNE